jgi:hypothetical protein
MAGVRVARWAVDVGQLLATWAALSIVGAGVMKLLFGGWPATWWAWILLPMALTAVGGMLAAGWSLALLWGGPRRELRWFSRLQEDALRKNDHKGGWTEEPLDRLDAYLLAEVDELEDALREMEPTEDWGDYHVIEEAADVANLAMMLADRTRHPGFEFRFTKWSQYTPYGNLYIGRALQANKATKRIEPFLKTVLGKGLADIVDDFESTYQGHDAKVGSFTPMIGNKLHYAYCNCGYTGNYHDDVEAANIDRMTHMHEVLIGRCRGTKLQPEDVEIGNPPKIGGGE